jgi:hypothetical protein
MGKQHAIHQAGQPHENSARVRVNAQPLGANSIHVLLVSGRGVFEIVQKTMAAAAPVRAFDVGAAKSCGAAGSRSWRGSRRLLR